MAPTTSIVLGPGASDTIVHIDRGKKRIFCHEKRVKTLKILTFLSQMFGIRWITTRGDEFNSAIRFRTNSLPYISIWDVIRIATKFPNTYLPFTERTYRSTTGRYRWIEFAPRRPIRLEALEFVLNHWTDINDVLCNGRT